MTDSIDVAQSDDDYAAFEALIREYEQWLYRRYADFWELMEGVLAHQALDAELADLRGCYGPPQGRTFLARRDGAVTGGGAYHDLHDGSCEMKRLFVPERFQGHGTGRALCAAIIDAATADGFALMRLDTGFRNTEAIEMYSSLGFRPCAPYQDYPEGLAQHLRFMERPLSGVVHLREISPENRAAVEALAVDEVQNGFVAGVAESIVEAAAEPDARPWFRAVYAGDEPVGFVMLSDGITVENPEYLGPYYLWRLLIDSRHQGKGYGAAAIRLAVDHLRTRPDARVLLTSCGRGPGSPLGFYLGQGFRPTGQTHQGETVLALDLSAYGHEGR